MDQSSVSVSIWLAHLKCGDPAAAQALWNAYFTKMVTLARMKLGTAPRVARDEEDVALSAFASFCGGVSDGRFPQLDDRDDLWAILFTITDKKAASHARYEGRQKRGGGKVVQASAVGANAPAPDPLSLIPAREPTAEEAELVADEAKRLLDVLVDGILRRIAIWKMEGHTNPEIAKLLGKSEPTVERKLKLIRQTWVRSGVVGDSIRGAWSSLGIQPLRAPRQPILVLGYLLPFGSGNRTSIICSVRSVP